MNTNYQQIGQEYLDTFKITLCPRISCRCWSRTHAHVKERKICKMDLPKSRNGLFEFLHEVGHIVAENANYSSNVPRALAEHNATQWGIAQLQQRHIKISNKQRSAYNRYVSSKLRRGLRRGLQTVPPELQKFLTPMQKATIKFNRQQRKGVTSMAMTDARKAYMNSEKGKAARKKYQESEKGKAARARYMAKKAAQKAAPNSEAN